MLNIYHLLLEICLKKLWLRNKTEIRELIQEDVTESMYVSFDPLDIPGHCCQCEVAWFCPSRGYWVVGRMQFKGSSPVIVGTFSSIVLLLDSSSVSSGVVSGGCCSSSERISITGARGTFLHEEALILSSWVLVEDACVLGPSTLLLISLISEASVETC